VGIAHAEGGGVIRGKVVFTMKRRVGPALAVFLLSLWLGSACGADDGNQSPGGGGGTSPAVTTPPVGTSPEPAPPSGGTPTTWTSDPVEVERDDLPVPPVPVLTNIRSAAHTAEGFDRIVFDFQAALPGYEVKYVSEVIEDGSGRTVTVPGRRFLQITMRPAQAHTDAGVATAPRARTLGYPMLKAYAIVGDFEGVVSVALGLDDVVGFRVGELPGRIYIDVAA
jgi:hypothetical protein